MPEFLPDTGCPPPGRFAVTWEEAEACLVQADRFKSSSVRAALWHELSVHKSLVTTVVGAVERIWLGGSFVSDKLDPSDVDLAYLIAPNALDSIASEPEDVEHLARLASREWCMEQRLRIDAYMLRLPATVDFWALGVTGAMAPGDDEVFYRLGLYDEIWQRCRAGSPTGRRGYVEVSL